MRARTNVCPNDRIAEASTEHFSYKFCTCTNPFIHLLGSSLIQWMIVRLNGKEEPKTELVGTPRRSFATPRRRASLHLGGALLCLSGEVRLSRALLQLGRPENTKNLVSGPLRRRSLHLGEALCLGVDSYA